VQAVLMKRHLEWPQRLLELVLSNSSNWRSYRSNKVMTGLEASRGAPAVDFDLSQRVSTASAFPRCAPPFS